VLLPAFVTAAQLPDVIEAIVGIFRDSDELRNNRTKARMKFLFLTHGWTAESFLAEVQRRIGYPLAPRVAETLPGGGVRDHVGIHAQKQAGLSYAGFSVLSGRITPEELRHIAVLAEQFGDGTLRTTASQNILVLNIPDARLAAFRIAARSSGVPLDGLAFQRGTLSCTGSEFCKLAITETKQFSIRLARELDDRLPEFDHVIKLNVTGCPNSCGQHWIADVGLQGVLIGQGSDQVEGFDFFVGGGIGARSGIARRVGFRAPADDVADALERLFIAFTNGRRHGESFHGWTRRVGNDEVKSVLSGASALEPVLT
jgi:sulfite reductase (ferredoxin)